MKNIAMYYPPPPPSLFKTFGALLIALLGFAPSALGQSYNATYMDSIAHPPYTNGRINFKSSSHLIPTDVFSNHANAFGLSNDDQLQLHRLVTDKYGYTHYYFHHFYKQVRVIDSHFAIHAQNGYARTGKGNLKTDINISAEPSLTENTALDFALSAINAPYYKWQIANEEQLLKEMSQDSTATYYPVGKLGIMQDENNPQIYYLSYAFYINTLSDELFVLIDANTGQLLKLQSTMKHAAPHLSDDCVSEAQTANTTFYGQQTVYAIPQDDGGFLLKKDCLDRDPCHTIPIENAEDRIAINYKDEAGSLISGGFYSTDGTWTTDEQAAAATIQFGIGKAYDYWNCDLDLQTLWDDDNDPTTSTYVFEGSFVALRQNWENAGLTGYGTPSGGWDFVGEMEVPDNPGAGGGSWIFTFGMGRDNQVLQDLPIASMDIVGHEFTHGLLNALYDGGLGGSTMATEGGSIEEGVCDIFGAMLEYYTAPQTGHAGNWLSGDEVWGTSANSSATFARNMKDPKEPSTKPDNTPIQYPDTYLGAFWDNSDHHINSTIISRWFYLLSEGSGAIDDPLNDNNHRIAVCGIGRSKATDILLQTILLAGEIPTFESFTYDIQEAAATIFGKGSNEFAQTVFALHAVGLFPFFSHTDYAMNYISVDNNYGPGTVNIDDWLDSNGLLDNTTITSDPEINIDREVAYIDGQIIIPSNRTATLRNIDLYFAETNSATGQANVGIVVQRGAQLILENVRLRAFGCPAPHRWSGITVYGNPDIAQTTVVSQNPDGTVTYNTNDENPGILIVRGTTIENAKTAILTAKQNPDGSIDHNYAGGIAIIDRWTPPVPDFDNHRSLFRKNDIDVNVYHRRKPENALLPAVPIANDFIVGQVVSSIQHTDFVRNNNRPAVILNHVVNFPITESTFQPTTLVGQHRGTAIAMIHTKANISQNQFTHLQRGIYKFGYTPKKGGSRIESNDFESVRRGVYAANATYDRLQHNTFTHIPAIPNVDTYGIYTVAALGCSVRDNILYGNETTSNTYNSYGIVVDGDGGSMAEIAENRFKGTDYGLSMQGNNNNLQIDCNLFGDSQDPHRISAWAIVDGLVQEQGIFECNNPTAPADNEWEYAEGLCGAAQDMLIGSTVTPFIYNAHSSAPSVRTLPNLDDCVEEDNIVIQACFETKTEESCQSDDLMMPDDAEAKRLIAVQTLSSRIADLQQTIAENEAQDQLLAWIEDGGNTEGIINLINNPLLPASALTAAIQTLAQLSRDVQLSVVLRNNPPLSSERLRDILQSRAPLPQEVMQALAERTVPVATQVLQDLKEAQTTMPDVPNREILRRQKQQAENRLWHAQQLCGDLLLSLNNPTAALAQWQNASNQAFFALRLAEYYLSQGNTAAALAQLNALPNGSSDYAQCLLLSTNQISAAQQPSTLAALCNSNNPYARLIGNSLSRPPGDSLSYEHPIRKINVGSGKTGYVPMEVENTECVSISPNPANDFVTIQSRLANNSQLLLYNQSGKLMQTINLLQGQQVSEINTQDWKAGIYFYQLSTGNTRLQSGKLTVLHR